MSGVPRSSAFLPVIPEGALVPSRGFGIDVGGQLFVGGIGPARLGFGASLMRARGTTNAQARSASGRSTQTSAPSAVSALSGKDPIHVAMSLTAIIPQVSFNFGTSDGWSYLSGGYGATWIRATAAGTGAPPAAGPVALVKDSGASPAVNYGGGARWFIRTHAAVGFDLRVMKVRSSGFRPATSLAIASVGLSVR